MGLCTAGGSVNSGYELFPGYKFRSMDLSVAFGISPIGDFLGVCFRCGGILIAQ